MDEFVRSIYGGSHSVQVEGTREEQIELQKNTTISDGFDNLQVEGRSEEQTEVQTKRFGGPDSIQGEEPSKEHREVRKNRSISQSGGSYNVEDAEPSDKQAEVHNTTTISDVSNNLEVEGQSEKQTKVQTKRSLSGGTYYVEVEVQSERPTENPDKNKSIKSIWDRVIDLQKDFQTKLQKSPEKPKTKGQRSPEKPKLVLSVIGDSSSFVPKPWRTSVLQTGIIETVKGAKDCLILYKGSTEKISTLVRKAVESFYLLHEKDNDNFIYLVALMPDTQQPPNHKLQSYCVVEEFIPIKNYTPELYAGILESISKEWTLFIRLQKDLEIKVPVLTIVAGGDLETINTVHEILNKGLPVLILKGSGNAADFIAHFHESDIDVGDGDSVQDFIAEKIPLLFGIIHQEDNKKLTNHLLVIKKTASLITVIDIEKQTKAKDFINAVDSAIIRGRSKVKRSDFAIDSEDNDGIYFNVRETTEPDSLPSEKHLLRLYEDGEITRPPRIATPSSFGHNKVYPTQAAPMAVTDAPVSVTMNVIRYKPSEINSFMENYQKELTPASLPLFFYMAYQFIQEYKEDKEKNFQILLKEAIIADQNDYVSVLLEEDVKFLHFTEIYQETIKQLDTMGDDYHHILKWGPKTAVSLLKDAYNNEKNDESRCRCNEYDMQCINAGRQCCQSLLGHPIMEYPGNKTNDKDAKEQQNGNYVYEDLLIWSVISNRPKLATLFWMNCKNQLLGALLVSCMFKNMALEVKSVRDQSSYDDMMEQSRIFAERALNLLSKLFKEDQELTMELVITPETFWDITVSPLQCAYENNMLDFISHSCCQRRLNKTWYNEIGGTLWEFWKKGFFGGCCCCFQFKVVCPCRPDGPSHRPKDEKYEFKLGDFIEAPLTKFLIHYAFFLAALVCYSAFLLTELGVYTGLDSMHIYEWIVYAYFYGDVLEEYRISNIQIVDTPKAACPKQKVKRHYWLYRFKRYFYNFWNILDVLSYIMLTFATFIRFFKPSSSGNLARRFYSLSLFIMYMRFLHVLLMSRKLGPKIIMIKEMLKDLFRFIGILFVFMMGVGVLYHANMYPKHADLWNPAGWEYWRIWKIIYLPYWQIYGDSFLDIFQANSTTPCTTVQSEWESNPDIERCSQYDWVLIVIAAIYMLISNLLLVNLVIALFSYRFERVQENSEKLWRYHRYSVIMDFQSRIPTPLNVVIRPLMILLGIFRKCKTNQTPCIDEKKSNNERISTLQYILAVQCTHGE